MTSMMELIAELWHLKRDIISDDFDRALYRLSQEFQTEFAGMVIHQYPTGERCWTWQIPEKWTCLEGYIESSEGKKILDYANNPLHVISYSLPYEGIVNLQELLDHLHVHPKLADGVPFVFKYYERDWGFCIAKNQLDNLVEDQYHIVLRTKFDKGELKLGEVIIPGLSDDTVMLVAHLCHPAMVNDDLTGVVVGTQVAKTLLAGPPPYYTYRLLILPETIGSVVYLSHNEHLIPKMVGGLFLEMLGNASPHALQQSFQPNSQFDLCMVSALKGLDRRSYNAPYRTVINNDERQFNAPGVRVPMLSLSRVEPPGSPTRPYREYHSSLDTPDIVSEQRLEESKRVVLELIRAWENNQYVVNNFKGEIFGSGYGIWIDYHTNPDGHRLLFDIMERCDGEHTPADIAFELNTSFQAVWEIVSLLREKNLVRLNHISVITSPR